MSALIEVQRNGQMAVVRMTRPPANAINGEMCRTLLATIDELEADEKVAGVVLAGREGMYSAGLDVIELYGLDAADMEAFWAQFTEVFLRIFGSSLVWVAAIEGHAPAGGCVLALACDHRVMAQGRYKIGLNEVAIGLAVPRWLSRVHASIVGRRRSERLLQLGHMLRPDEALAAGLVDDVVDQGKVLEQCRAELETRLSVPQVARHTTKMSMRRELLLDIESESRADGQALLQSWYSEECREVLGHLVEKLGGGDARF
jgi:enoyl-CoA hydratase/carnithine racemase